LWVGYFKVESKKTGWAWNSMKSESLKLLVSSLKSAHSSPSLPYYKRAEKTAKGYWKMIEKRVEKNCCDLSYTVEIAPGHGRISQFLCKRSKVLHLVDVNQSCINACKKRFRGRRNIKYHVNNGYSLKCIASNKATFVVSWDSFVHFHRSIVDRYLSEISRILRVGGYGLLHHSNFSKRKNSWTRNPAWRAYMPKGHFNKLCGKHNLTIVDQKIIPWGGKKNLDCISVFRNL